MERPKILILDASVVIKWFIEESNSAAYEIREQYGEDKINIAVPDLLFYEFANALLKGKKQNAEFISEALELLNSMGMFVYKPSPHLMNVATKLAEKFNLTIYDAVYIALGSMLGGEVVTADEKVITKVKDLAFVRLL